ncbi:MAG: HDOD domain-containing protein [Desulfuromonadaceae bacterium]|nr:HDOD domain-containing protein [Desulfuromonas sp.]MDY0184978.1 HDOD domain-containing protein [Desulfuromonadaceae bacterium]
MEQRATRADILAAIKEIPLLSPSASRLLQIASRDDYNIDEIIEVVKCDSALTARLLKTVNSVAYGLVHQVTSIERAVSYLGERLVAGIALEDSAKAVFNKKLEGYESPVGELWEHDLRTAVAAREIARHSNTDLSKDLAFTAGILHAIGKAVLSDFLHESAPDLLANIDSHDIRDYLEGERKILGMDHAEAGFELAKAWELPESLQMAIRHHHTPQQAPEQYRPLVYAVHLGCIIAMMSGSQSSDALQYHLDKDYSDYFNITNEHIAMILLEVNESVETIQAALTEGREQAE